MTSNKKIELLNHLLSSGKIVYDDVAKVMENLNVLDKHSNKIWQAKDGRWKTHVPDASKKSGRRLVARKSEEDLYEYLIEFYEDDLSSLTFEQLYNKWMHYRTIEVTESTRNSNQYYYEKYYMNAEINNMKVKDITTLDVKIFILTTLKNHPMNRKKYTNMSTVLKKALAYGVELKVIGKSPMDDFKLPRNVLKKEPKQKSEDEVFTKKEEKMIISFIDARFYKWNLAYLAVKLNFQLGLRVGELCALKWSDISDRYISIQRSEKAYREMDENNKRGKTIITVEDEPKTSAGFRELYLTKEAMGVLSEVREISFSKGWYDKNGYIFVGKGAKRLPSRNMHRVMEKACKDLGLEHRGIHSIRKTILSSLIDSGMNLEEVRRIAGHENIKTLLDNYYYDRTPRKETEEILDTVL